MLNPIDDDESEERRAERERQMQLLAENISGRNLPNFLDEEEEIVFVAAGSAGPDSPTDGSLATSGSLSSSARALELEIAAGMHVPPLGSTDSARQFLWDDDDDDDGEGLTRNLAPGGEGGGRPPPGRNLHGASVYGGGSGMYADPAAKKPGFGARLLRGLVPSFSPVGRRSGGGGGADAAFSNAPNRRGSIDHKFHRRHVSFPSHRRHDSVASAGSVSASWMSPVRTYLGVGLLGGGGGADGSGTAGRRGGMGLNLAPRRFSTSEHDDRAMTNVDLSMPDVDYDYDGTYGGDRYAGYDADRLRGRGAFGRTASETAIRAGRTCATGAAACCSVLAGRKDRRAAVLLVAAVALVVAAVVAAVVASSARGSSGGSDDGDDPAARIAARIDALSRRIADAGVSARSDLEVAEPLTPQRRAIEWLAEGDPMALDPGDEFLLQRYALAVFWYATHGDIVIGLSEGESADWKEDDNWMSGRSVCAWHGVACRHRRGTPTEEAKYEKDNMVTQLVMEKNNIYGKLPREVLTCLRDLRTLNLHFNQLLGTIGEEIGFLHNLESLDLGENSFYGPIPQAIGKLDKLTVLDLGDNVLEGTVPETLGQLSGALAECSLFANVLVGTIPESLADLTLLRSLYLDSNQLTGTIPSALGRLTHMVDLRMRENQLGGSIPSELGDLEKLEALYVDTNGLTGPVPSELARLGRLEELRAHGNKLWGTLPPELGGLSALSHVYLDGNYLTGPIPAEWAAWGNIRHLFLDKNQLFEHIPSQLGAMGSLEILQLGHNLFSGSIPAELGKLSQMTELTLEENHLVGTVPEELGGLENLEKLLLHGNRLTGAVPETVCRLTTEKALKEMTAQCPANSSDGGALLQCSCCTECP